MALALAISMLAVLLLVAVSILVRNGRLRFRLGLALDILIMIIAGGSISPLIGLDAIPATCMIILSIPTVVGPIAVFMRMPLQETQNKKNIKNTGSERSE